MVELIREQSKGSLSTGLEIRVVVYIYGWCQIYHCDIQLFMQFGRIIQISIRVVQGV
jgi:hypothetical protein